jgi:DNA-binding response OmpR family regulator
MSDLDMSSRWVALWADDPAALPGLARALAEEGLRAVPMATGDAQIRAGPDGAPDAVLLRIPRNVPEHLGRLRGLRERWPLAPLLVACHDLRELDHVLALEMGADDVIALDWSAAVVAARLRAQWRRAAQGAQATAHTEELRFGSLWLGRRERSVMLAGRVVPFTEGEFDVLWLLASHAGSALSRRDILRRVRGVADHLLDRSVDSRVYRIRAKLGDTHSPQQRIRTLRNRGYLLSPVGW